MTRTLLLAALLWSTLTVDQQHGREIYRQGKLAGASVGTAAIGSAGVPLPASSFPCANCHGIWGEGGRESGIDPPPLNRKRLSSPAVSPVTGRHRAAYTPETLARAITEGLDPSGARLYVGMPRYTMPRERLAELLAYLERSPDPGAGFCRCLTQRRNLRTKPAIGGGRLSWRCRRVSQCNAPSGCRRSRVCHGGKHADRGRCGERRAGGSFRDAADWPHSTVTA
jgi:hypothetical protein